MMECLTDEIYEAAHKVIKEVNCFYIFHGVAAG